MRTTLARIGGALAVLLAFLVPTLTVSAASAAPAASCVGVVVDSGQGTPATACIPYTTGLTGAKVLEKAGHKLAFASSGLLCQIDGYPTACTSDAKHYWSYYQRKPGGAASAWDYATKGPTTLKVKPGEIDAFVYVNGKDRKPGTVTYASIAAAAAASSAPPASSTASSSSPSSSPSKATGAATNSDSGSSHTGLIIAIVVVVVLVVAAGLQLMLRRRRAS